MCGTGVSDPAEAFVGRYWKVSSFEIQPGEPDT